MLINEFRASEAREGYTQQWLAVARGKQPSFDYFHRTWTMKDRLMANSGVSFSMMQTRLLELITVVEVNFETTDLSEEGVASNLATDGRGRSESHDKLCREEKGRSTGVVASSKYHDEIAYFENSLCTVHNKSEVLVD
jgi:hypothetical protein